MGVIDHDRQTGIQRLELLAALGDRIREIDDPGELAYAAAELLGRNLKISRAGYGTVDLKRETITIEGDWKRPVSIVSPVRSTFETTVRTSRTSSAA